MQQRIRRCVSHIPAHSFGLAQLYGDSATYAIGVAFPPPFSLLFVFPCAAPCSWAYPILAPLVLTGLRMTVIQKTFHVRRDSLYSLLSVFVLVHFFRISARRCVC